ncbi:MAG TPA: VWA domain-containing protein [Thermoanaerobaculia bacterium]|nr:VWA domain-containing protein [Thermoanaerobaculia bacterium]
MKRSLSWFVAAAIAALPLAAQERQDEIPVINESIDVRVVNVEAVVTAASGERVNGLSAADFRLLVDGQEVPVEYFAEVKEGTAVDRAAGPAEAPAAPVSAGEEVGRSYLVYVDDSFSLANKRNALLEKIERDLALLEPEDQMAVLAFDSSRIDVLCGWTRDRAKLREALERARQRRAQGGTQLSHQRALQADVDWVEVSADSLETGDSDRVGGPKVHEMDAILGDLGKRISPEARTQLGKTALAVAAALRGFETPPGRKVMLLLSGAWSLSVAPQLYGPVVEAANRLGYTVYPVDAAQSDATEVTALDSLARATGGRAVVSADNAVFHEVVEDSGTYYWLGFTPSWKANDQTHRVTVEVRRRGLAVRTRGSFSDLSRRTETAIKAESVLLFGGTQEDRRLIVQLGESKKRGHNLEVPVTLGVPIEALALTPQGNGYLAEVPLAVAAEDASGRRIDLPALRLKVLVAALPKAGTYARFQTVLLLRDAGHRLVFTVEDPGSGHALWNEAELAAQK